MAQIQVYADEELKNAIEQLAREKDRSISYIIRQWIEQGLEQHGYKRRRVKGTQKVEAANQQAH